MYSTWTKNIQDPEEKANFERTVQSARPVLRRLTEMLEEEERALDRSEVDIKTFDLPNWAHRQAYKNGYRASLGIQKKLINLDQQKDPTLK